VCVSEGDGHEEPLYRARDLCAPRVGFERRSGQTWVGYRRNPLIASRFSNEINGPFSKMRRWDPFGFRADHMGPVRTFGPRMRTARPTLK